MRVRTLRPSALSAAHFVCLLATLVSGPAFADCLTGEGAVGMETGNQTVSVALKNMTPDLLNLPAICGPNQAWIDPGVFGASTGVAEFATDSLGYSARAGVFAGALISGQTAATVAGSVRYALRVVSQPGYAGPTTLDLDIRIDVDVTGSGTASGLGSSFSGTFASDGSIKELGAFGSTSLYHAGGAPSTAGSSTFLTTSAVDIDTDYIVTFPLSLQVSAYSGFDPQTSMLGTAASSGTVFISWGPSIADGFVDPDLALQLEMVTGTLGLDMPSPGSPPLLPSQTPAVPALHGVGALLAPTALGFAGWLAQSRSRASFSPRARRRGFV